jgi:hypothetical protein
MNDCLRRYFYIWSLEQHRDRLHAKQGSDGLMIFQVINSSFLTLIYLNNEKLSGIDAGGLTHP